MDCHKSQQHITIHVYNSINIYSSDVPDPPVIVEKDNRATPFSITVKWHPGWNGGPKQTFTIEYSSNGVNGIIQNILDGEGAQSYKLTKGISPQKAYTIVIYARNAMGDSPSVTWPIISTPGINVNQGMTFF